MNTLRLRSVLAAVSVLLLSLTACSGNAGDKEVAPVGDSELFAQLPQSIQDSGTLRIAVLADYPPATYKDESGSLVGYEIELGEALAAELGVSADFQPSAFASVLTGIQAGRYDTGLSSMADLPEREATANFVNYLGSGLALLVPKENPDKIADSGDSLCGLTIAATRGTMQVDIIEGYNANQCSEDPIEIPLLDTPAEAITQVQTSRADGYMADAVVAKYLADQAEGGTGTELEVIPIADIDLPPAGMPVHLDNRELSEVLVKAWNNLIKEGTYLTILENWGVEMLAIDEATINAGSKYSE